MQADIEGTSDGGSRVLHSPHPRPRRRLAGPGRRRHLRRRVLGRPCPARRGGGYCALHDSSRLGHLGAGCGRRVRSPSREEVQTHRGRGCRGAPATGGVRKGAPGSSDGGSKGSPRESAGGGAGGREEGPGSTEASRSHASQGGTSREEERTTGTPRGTSRAGQGSL